MASDLMEVKEDISWLSRRICGAGLKRELYGFAVPSLMSARRLNASSC